jgi:hypothetical protein
MGPALVEANYYTSNRTLYRPSYPNTAIQDRDKILRWFIHIRKGTIELAYNYACLDFIKAS